MNTQAESQKGFTLIELMIAIAIVALLVTVGVPELRNFLLNNRLTAEANAFVAAVNFARAEAITYNREVHIAALDNSNNLNEWGKMGWVVWSEGHPNCGVNVPVNDGIRTVVNGESCEELRRYEIAGSKILLDGPNDLGTLSMARTVKAEDRARTLTYRGDGSLAISGARLSFSVYDSRYNRAQTAKGRCIVILRSGRVVMENADYQCS
jgi:prepilin-type N-terminal cleavage/methylation domain-containing protein